MPILDGPYWTRLMCDKYFIINTDFLFAFREKKVTYKAALTLIFILIVYTLLVNITK